MTKLSPIESEFATSEDVEAHDAWFRAKIEKAMVSKEPGIPRSDARPGYSSLRNRRRTRASAVRHT